MAETKTYPYVILEPTESGIAYTFRGEFPGRSPEQAVEAFLASLDPGASTGGPPLKGGVVAIPSSKWWVVEWEGTPRVDYKFSRVGAEEGDVAAQAGEAAAGDPPAGPDPADLAPEDAEGLKRL